MSIFLVAEDLLEFPTFCVQPGQECTGNVFWDVLLHLNISSAAGAGLVSLLENQIKSLLFLDHSQSFFPTTKSPSLFLPSNLQFAQAG